MSEIEDARRALKQAEAEAEAAAIAAATAEKPIAPAMPSEASLLGLPDELPITWCPHCKADVKPKGRGSCPRCNKYLKGSFAARRHPVSLLRRDQILKRLVAEYRTETRGISHYL